MLTKLMCSDLTRMKVTLTEIKTEKYATKLAFQKSIDRLLAESNEEFIERIHDFCVSTRHPNDLFE